MPIVCIHDSGHQTKHIKCVKLHVIPKQSQENPIPTDPLAVKNAERPLCQLLFFGLNADLVNCSGIKRESVV
jgi:hypothetical protein